MGVTTPSSGQLAAGGEGRGGHVPALDALRGIAVLLVLVFHLKPTVPLSPGLGWWSYRALQAGWCGVDLFFVLSGFLITGILWDAKGATAYFRTFYARRVLRIFPLYYGALALVFLVWPLVVASTSDAYRTIAGRQGWLWLYASNVRIYLTGRFGFFEGHCHVNHFWSLAVEEHFYLLWPLAVFLLSRRALMALCGAAVVMAVTWRVLLVRGGHSFVCAYTFTPCRLDALAIGAYLALGARGPARLARLRPSAVTLAGLCGAALLGLFALRGGLVIEDPWMQTAGYTALAVFFAAVLVVTATAAPASLLGRVGRSRFLRLFGKYSYGLYVWHGLVLPFVQDMTPYLTERLGSAVLVVVVQLCLSITFSLAIALASWHLLEKQFLKLKRFFEYRRADRPSLPGECGPVSERETASRAH